MIDDKRILSRKEAATRLGVSEKTLDKICATSAELRKIQLSVRRVGIAEADITAYLSRGARTAA